MGYPGLNLKDLTDEQLQKKLSEISVRLAKPGIRADITNQLKAIFEALRTEVQERIFKKVIETDPKWQPGVVLDTQDDKKDKDEFDKLININ
ncbi:MAG: hypothetical protein HC836_30325 [Richelia sp. RM2_1_2]|nr:hypothetical protein [Richelia sp. RM2_1_2]